MVFIIERGPRWARSGVMLNRLSDVALRDVLPLWDRHFTVPRALYVGGPMQPRAVLCVAALPAGVDAKHTEGMIKQPRDLVIGPHVARGRADTAGHRLWSRILRRQGPPLTLLATYRTDPVLN